MVRRVGFEPTKTRGLSPPHMPVLLSAHEYSHTVPTSIPLGKSQVHHLNALGACSGNPSKGVTIACSQRWSRQLSVACYSYL